jgi:MFS family permease
MIAGLAARARLSVDQPSIACPDRRVGGTIPHGQRGSYTRRTVRLPRALGVLREGSFARYLGAITVSTLGSGISQVALAFAVLDFGGATDLGIVLLAREIPMIAFLLVGGVFADRVRRRTILVGSDVVKGCAQLGTAILLFSGAADVWNVALIQVVFGSAAAFSRPATLGLIREAVSDERLQEANALAGLSRNVLQIAGPAIGALIVTAGSPAWALAADAASFFASALLTASMRLGPTIRLAATSIVGDLRGGWNELVARPWAVAMIVSFGLFQLTFFPAVFVLGPLVAKDALGGAGAWGALLSVNSAGAVLGGLAALRLRVRRPLVVCQLAVIPAGLLVIALAAPAPILLLGILSALSGAGFAFGGTLWETALQRNVPVHALSRISSFDWLGSVALNPLGYALIGPIAAVVGMSSTLALAGTLNIATLVVVVLLPSVRAITTTPQASASG